MFPNISSCPLLAGDGGGVEEGVMRRWVAVVSRENRQSKAITEVSFLFLVIAVGMGSDTILASEMRGCLGRASGKSLTY